MFSFSYVKMVMLLPFLSAILYNEHKKIYDKSKRVVVLNIIVNVVHGVDSYTDAALY